MPDSTSPSKPKIRIPNYRIVSLTPHVPSRLIIRSTAGILSALIIITISAFFFFKQKNSAFNSVRAISDSLVLQASHSENIVSRRCDPYQHASGYVSPKTGAWIQNNWTSNPICITENEGDNLYFLQLSTNANLTKLPSFLANKLVLLIGDSFERHLIDTLCHGRETFKVTLNGTFITGKALHGDSRICVIRAGKDVFVAINVFHFGFVASPTPRFPLEGKHWEEGMTPLDIIDRIHWVPHLLRSAAGHAFPEWCLAAGQECPPAVWMDRPSRQRKTKSRLLTDSTPPLLDPLDPFWYPVPDLIVAQSSIWDLARFGHTQELREGGPWFNAFAQEWIQNFPGNVMKPVEDVFCGGGTKKPFLYLRTMPLPKPGSRFTHPRFSMIHSMNQMLRKEIFRGSDVVGRKWGLLDWDNLVEGIEKHVDEKKKSDGEHPNSFVNSIFWQLLLSRLEILNI
ncbi:hypothetical protein BCR33DRAFT_716938 [Rhizoclosmatium globosum]|uniref:Uncharacterized protein n=1 Tax=Rhizoclosmatium globosum TaxID=329046 RepID=A0A1Y2CBI1_9FUNG|nr:hypothetical protein BCR33DRAFT_716938 [Rhizoclosmatium globosum]|eukprot:ORY44393.1 hypothetical protein BCR33DRAFT_716938 [Rhizoclosmatium globosum]